MTEKVTGIALVNRKLDDLGIQSIVKEYKIPYAVELSAVKCGGNGDIAVLAFIGFKPTKTVVRNRELVSVYLCNLKNAQCTGRLLVDRNVFSSVVLASLERDASPEGLLLLIVKPTISIDESNGGTLTLTIEVQNQLVVVGRSQYFARCGAVKKNVGENGAAVHCKIPIDSSKCTHCTYHSNTKTQSTNIDNTSVGSKRPLIVTAEPASKRLQVNDYVTAAARNDRDASLTEQDDDDVAFSLRRHSTAVQSILGAAYTVDNRSSTNGTNVSSAAASAHILKKADPLELRVAQKIISTMAAQSNTLSSAVMGANGAQLPHSTTTKLLARPVSALTQRVEKQTLARSGNQSNIQSYGRPNTAPAVTSSTLNSTTARPAAQGPGQYKLVGDTLVNSANLLRNVANIKAPPPSAASGGAYSATSQGARPSQNQSQGQNLSQNGFQQLLSGVVPTRVGSVYAPRTGTQPVSGAATKTAPGTTNTGGAVNISSTGTSNNSKSRLDAEIDALLGRASTHAGEADADWAEGFGQRMDVLAKREYAQTKAAEVHSIEISAFKCMQCESRLTEQFPALCQNNGHTVHKVKCVKRFFECGQCAKREYSLSDRKDLTTKIVLPPEIRCTQCGAFRWRACGQRGSGPLSVSVGDAKRPANVENGKLILSASEWTKRGDSVSMAERVSRLN